MKSLVLLLFGLLTVLGLNFNACVPSRGLNTNDPTHKMEFDGRERSYIVHLPPKEKMNGPLPLLFHLHGGGGTAKGTPGLTFGRFNTLADRDGFIVVYPNAINKNWNDGRKLENVLAWKEDIDDVGFITAIVDELKQKHNIDSTRIFTTGMSNGGFMSSRLLCDRANIFRGGAILTASLSKDYLPQCKPEKPVAIMVMNGTDDPLVPYNGGQVKVFRKTRGEIVSTDEYIAFWKDKNDCEVNQDKVDLPDIADDGTTVSVSKYSDCKEEGALVLYTVDGGWAYLARGQTIFGRTLDWEDQSRYCGL